MNVTSIASSTTAAASAARTGDAVQVSVLKKALSAQNGGALSLLQGVSSPASSAPTAPSAMGSVGKNVNTFA